MMKKEHSFGFILQRSGPVSLVSMGC